MLETSFVTDNREEFANILLAFFADKADMENMKVMWIDIIRDDPWFDKNVRTPALYEDWNEYNTISSGMADDLSNIAKGKIK